MPWIINESYRFSGYGLVVSEEEILSYLPRLSQLLYGSIKDIAFHQGGFVPGVPSPRIVTKKKTSSLREEVFKAMWYALRGSNPGPAD